MRGLIIGVLVLTGLNVVLASPASRIATLLDRPTSWLAAWMDPSRPLIPEGHLPGAGGGTTLPGGGVKPSVPGHCPPGHLWDAKTGICLQELP